MPRNDKTRTAAETDTPAAEAPTKRTRKAAQTADTPAAETPTKRTRKAAQLAEVPAAEGQQDAPAAESQQDAPAAESQQDAPAADSDQNHPEGQPAGMAPEGVITRVVDPKILKWDPNVHSGRTEDEYDPEKNEKMRELMAAMKASAEESGRPYGNDTSATARIDENGDLLLVTGRRRQRGALLLGLMLKVEIVSDMSLRRARVTATTENTHQAGVSELGEARQYAALLAEEGLSERELAVRVGKSQSHINKAVAVLAMPEFVHTRIQSNEISFSTAYIALNGFRKLPTEAAAEAWATLARAWQHMKKPVTVDSLRTQMYTIVRTLSRPLDAARLIGNEIAPRFDLAAHDAACDCGRPEIKLSEHVKPAPRCYKPARWEALQAEANKGRKATGNGNGNGGTTNGSTSKPSVSAAPAAVPTGGTVAPTAATSTPAPAAPSSPSPAINAPEVDEAPARSLYPTYSEFRSAYGVQADSMVIVRDFRPDAIASAVLPVLLDWNELPPAGNGDDDAVRIIYGPRGPESFCLVCVDSAVMVKAKRAAIEAVKERAEQIRERDRASFSEAVATASKSNAEALAWIVSCAGDVPPAFGANTAQMLGLDVPQSATVEELAALPKGVITRIVQAMAYRMSEGDIEWHSDDAADRAREEIRAEYAVDYAAYMNSFPMPGEEGAPEQHAGAQDAPATAEGEVQQDAGAAAKPGRSRKRR